MSTIKIGIEIPMTGPLTAYGSDVSHGVMLAIRHINARGGVLGRMLEQKVYDDAGDSKQAVAVANRLVSEGVKFMIGNPCSNCAFAAADTYDDEGVLTVLPAATSPDITGRGHKLLFRTVGTDVLQASVACDWIAAKVGPGGAKIAIVHDKQTHGQGIATAVGSELKDRGLEAVLFQGIMSGERDFSSVIKSLESKDVGFVYYGGYYPELAALLRQARAAGLKAKFMASDAAVTSEVFDYAQDAAEGLLVTSPGTFDELAQHKALTKEMRDEGRDFTSPAAFSSYAAVEVLAQGITAAGDCDDTEKIAQAIHSGKFETTIGSLCFRPNGDLTSSQFVVEECHLGKPRTKAG